MVTTYITWLLLLGAAFAAGYEFHSVRNGKKTSRQYKSTGKILVNDMENGLKRLKASCKFGRFTMEPLSLLPDWKAEYARIAEVLDETESQQLVSYYQHIQELAYCQKEGAKEIERLRAKGIRDLRSFHDIHLDRLRNSFLDIANRTMQLDLDRIYIKLQAL